ncbi:fumarate hydratase [Daejeonella sp.]|uniref:fumarate hydratase n=1 Tax=Daejeonella sp. TaxID=2805397 RepID=UPI003983D9F2
MKTRFLLISTFAPGFLILFTCALYSCKFNANMQAKGSEDLQGIWEEGLVAYQDERLQYSKHQFQFICDSVYITVKTFAKVNTYPDSCFNNGSWIEYAKGVYETREDTLLITATFTKANFKQKISGCYRIGQYLPAFVIKKSGGDSLNLEGLQDHLPLSLTLKKRTLCVQKPLN